MPVYTAEQWDFVVSELAAYVSPKTIVAEFNLRWPDSAFEPADISQFQRDKLPPDWQEHFDRRRTEFLNPPTKDSDVIHGELYRMFIAARDRGAVTLAADLLKQIESLDGAGSANGGASGTGGPITGIELIVVDPKPLPEPDK